MNKYPTFTFKYMPINRTILIYDETKEYGSLLIDINNINKHILLYACANTCRWLNSIGFKASDTMVQERFKQYTHDLSSN